MTVNNDKVGYKKPPKKNQFKKGKSGNPKGRPKKAEGEWDLILFKKFTLPRDGKTVKMTGLQLLQEMTLNEARKGKVSAARLLLKFHGFNV